ncbi:hypothetical protein [Evtepia sp.]|uniref:hypothetical protein n=1 Tax=Evtepia sp. TaxID=2773933 RepID=UPI00399BE36D
MAGLPQYTSNLYANLNYFFAFSEKKRKNTKKEEKNLPEYPPRLADVPGGFSKNEKRGKKISG